MVAAGRIDLVAETELKVWDWSALKPVVEAAGGRVTGWSGQAPDGDGRILAVGDAALTPQALAVLNA
ncbi:Inositol monophosphatase family protein [compost metagenome]